VILLRRFSSAVQNFDGGAEMFVSAGSGCYMLSIAL
jgi:hypothetical protein